MYHLRLQPSEVENMPYYEYEYIVQNLVELLKEKQEAEKGQSGDMSAHQMMADAKKNMPKVNSPKMPKVSTPKFPSVPNSLKM